MKLELKMKIIFLLPMFLMVQNVKAEESWPKVVHTFSNQTQLTYKQNNFLIEIKPLPITGGSGERHYEIIMSKDGKLLGKTLTETVFSFSVLDESIGFPQLEAWSSGGAENYTRLLYRWNDNKFSVVRIDNYIKTMNENALKIYTPAWAKEYGFALTYLSTGTPIK